MSEQPTHCYCGYEFPAEYPADGRAFSRDHCQSKPVVDASRVSTPRIYWTGTYCNKCGTKKYTDNACGCTPPTPEAGSPAEDDAKLADRLDELAKAIEGADDPGYLWLHEAAARLRARPQQEGK